jgi:hypothetical protein
MKRLRFAVGTPATPRVSAGIGSAIAARQCGTDKALYWLKLGGHWQVSSVTQAAPKSRRASEFIFRSGPPSATAGHRAR